MPLRSFVRRVLPQIQFHQSGLTGKYKYKYKYSSANQASLGNITAAVTEGAPDSLAVLGFFFEVLDVFLDVYLDVHFDVHLDKDLDINVNLDVHFNAWFLL